MLGSGKNWTRIAKMLEANYAVHLLDARNHGQSPHRESMTYPEMADDTVSWMDTHNLERAVVIGHSMGGKTAMTLASEYPERVDRLVVVDIAPKQYGSHWEKEFKLMRELDPSQFNSRSQADAALAGGVPNWAFRQFLLTNIERNSEGGFRWAINLPVIHDSLPALFENPLEGKSPSAQPALFIRGSYSKIFTPEDFDTVRQYFPNAVIREVTDAGHNVHFDQPEKFLEALKEG